MFAGYSLLYLLGPCAVLAAGMVLWLRQQQIFQREAFQALAARRGWSLTISEQKLGRPAILRLTARSGSGWHTESRLDAGDAPGMRSILTTVFAADEPRWGDGTLVLSLRPASDRAEPEGPLQGRSQAALDARIAAAVAPAVRAALQPHPAPDAVAVQATQNPAQRFDIEALSKAMAEWTPQRASVDGLPVVVVGPDGFRMQVSHGMRRAGQMEHFIDLALELLRLI